MDNLNSSYNNFNFDTDNIALLRFGVATSAADNRIGTALQSFGVGTNEGTVNTRFLAELPSSYNNPSISSDTITANATAGFTQAGVSEADSFLRAAFGFGSIPSPYTGMNQITSKGNYKYLTPTDASSSFYTNFLNPNSSSPSAFGSFNTSEVTDSGFANFNYIPMLNNSGMFNPIGNAIIKYSDDLDTALCDSSDGLTNCWNPVLCAANDGVWVDENEMPLCSNTTDVNFDTTNYTDCYPGKCVQTDSICSTSNCSQCSTQDMCPTDEGFCVWDSVSGCSLGCRPDSQQCSQCTSESNCTSPCTWLEDRQLCVYGSAQCNSDSNNKECCYDQTNYLIKIPTAFTSSGNMIDGTNATCTQVSLQWI